MVQTLHTPANILHVCIHKNVLTMLQQKLYLLVKCEYTKFLVSYERYPCLLMHQTNFEVYL